MTKKLAWAALCAGLVALAACGGGKSGADARVITEADGGDTIDSSNAPVCNVLTQTGCPNVGDKCSWIRVSTGAMANQQLGQVGCAPAGAVAIDGACTYGASGANTGYDDCIKGAQCLASPATEMAMGTCHSICSLSDLTAPCGAGFACGSYNKFFENSDTDTPLAGVCDPTCNPLTQIRDSDNAPKCGSPDVTMPSRGCYGAPSQDAGPTTFTCTGAGTGGHRTVVTPPIFLNSCAPGNIPLLLEQSGSTQVVCIAYCDPLPTNNTLPAANRRGMTPYSCPEVGATNGGEICQHLWFWEGTATPISDASNDFGFCVDFSKYTWDNDNDPGTAPVPWTPCQNTVPFVDIMNQQPTEDIFWGCVPYPTTLTGKPHIPRAADRGVDLRPLFSEEQMRTIVGH